MSHLSGAGEPYAVRPLSEALTARKGRREELENTAADYLRKESDPKDPVKVYTAIRIWEGYLRAKMHREKKKAVSYFRSKMDDFLAAFPERPFLNNYGKTPKVYDPGRTFFGFVDDMRTELSLWYPTPDRKQECVSMYESFFPVLTYYQNRLQEWGLVFRKCIICGKFFLASNLHYNLCGERCRKKRRKENKKDFDRRIKATNYEIAYKNETQNWRNRINKAKNTPDLPDGRIEKMEKAFKEFKKEALARKKEVKEGRMKVQDFTGWLYGEMEMLDKL